MSKSTGVVALLLASVLWGTTGTAASFNSASPLAIGAAALGIGGILQAIVGWRKVAESAARLPHTLLLAGAAGIFVYPLCFYTSMDLAGVAVGTVVSLGLAPMCAGLISRALWATALESAWWAASALGVAGCIALSLSDDPSATDKSSLIGIGLGVLAAASYATYSLMVGEMINTGIPRQAAMGSVFGLGGLALLPIMAITGDGLFATHNLPSTLYLIFVPMFAGYVLFGIGLASVPAHTAMVITLAEPAIAAVFAMAIVGERFVALDLAGIGLVAGALGLSVRR